MLHTITHEEEIRESQEKLEILLQKYLTIEDEYTIGFPSGSAVRDVIRNNNIWFTKEKNTDATSPRFWNAFGLSHTLDKKKSNSIIVEINIPLNGINRSVAGFFVKNSETHEILLMHRGKIGGGRKGIGKNTFLSWYRPLIQQVNSPDGKMEEAFAITSLKPKEFVNGLSSFIEKVSQFKKLVTSGVITEATYISDQELDSKLLDEKDTNKKPKKKKITTIGYQRDPYVVEYAKRRANGKCQLCLEKAPFSNILGIPYLEAHHIVWLSKNGTDSISNTVALCPNCHRKMHILNNKQDINILKDSIN